MHDLLASPARLGGMALINFISVADVEFSASCRVSNPLKNTILKQNFEYSDDTVYEQVEAKDEVQRMKREQSMQAAVSLKQSLSVSLQRSMDLAQEKGASTWLTTLPIQEFGLALHKRAFQDALAL